MKRLIILISAVYISGNVCLYAQNRHEFSLSAFGGISGLNYKVTEGSKNNQFGDGFGAEYLYGIIPQIGIRTGIELAFYNSKYSADELNVRYKTQDMYGGDFEFRSKIKDYHETQNATFLQIPLMLQYQTNGITRFYAAGGIRIGIPIAAKYKTDAFTIQNSGYYEFEDYEYTTQKFLGFGEFDIPEAEDNLNLKTAFFLSLETGCKFNISSAMRVYAGIYFDCGLNNITESAAQSYLIDYDGKNPREFTFNSILNSKTTQAVTEKVAPLSVGIKVRMGF